MFADKRVNVFRVPSFRAEHFPESGPSPWLDRDDAVEEIDRRLSRGKLTQEEASQCRKWRSEGYIIVKRLMPDSVLAPVWTAYENAVASGRIKLEPDSASPDDPYPGRYLSPHKRVGGFCRLLKHPGLLRWMRLLLDREPKVLQTIASHKGSQQPAHSDSIHMTTYPLGYLAAAWVAFEDIHPNSGPLVYFPGSHRLPYVFSKDVAITETELKRDGYASYQEKYEPRIRELIETHRLEPHYFHARKGDTLIWHANLVHGGAPRNNIRLSRRAVVCHFFAKGAFVYHDLAASWSKNQYMGTCLLRDEYGRSRMFGRRMWRLAADST